MSEDERSEASSPTRPTQDAMSDSDAMSDLPPPPGQLESLIADFFDDPPEKLKKNWASIELADTLASPYAELLDHNGHMTETLEAAHGGDVEVIVHRVDRRDDLYNREITLRSRSGETVMYGLVRLHVPMLQPEVWSEIESQSRPLGRVLIEHDVMRQVERRKLWRVTAGQRLGQILKIHSGRITYGRTAVIHCDGEPAIELLEIVSPR